MSQKVRAAVQLGPRQIEIQEFDRPQLGPEDGLLRIEANGICGSDVETYRGHMGMGNYPFIPGHEPMGIIEQIGEVAADRWGVKEGDRVALEVIVPCRTCLDCLTGRYQACKRRKYGHGVTGTAVPPAIWGGLSEYCYLSPTTVVHKIDNTIPAEVAVMYNPLGAGVRWAVHLGGAGLGDTALILGSGQRGLAAVIAARAAGAGTIIITGLESDEHKLALAREFGADHTIVVDGPNARPTPEVVAELTDGRLADVTLELTPMAQAPVADALLATRHGGTVVLAGLKGNKDVPLKTDLIINRGLVVKGAFGVDSDGYEDAIAIIESGRFPLERMHTHSFGLEETAHAIEVLGGEVEGESPVHVSVHPNG